MNLQPHEGGGPSTESMSNATTAANLAVSNELSPARRASSSNNILNANLSGSFRDAQPISERGSIEDDYDDALGTIYAPSVQPADMQTPRWPSTQYQPLSNSRLGVAAIPNQNFSQSAAVPLLHDDSGSNGRRNQRNAADNTDTQRRSPASSTQYFV